MFFRAGVLGMMEEIREEKIAKILSWMQAAARGKMARIAYKKLQEQKVCVSLLPRCVKLSKMGGVANRGKGIVLVLSGSVFYGNFLCETATNS